MPQFDLHKSAPGPEDQSRRTGNREPGAPAELDALRRFELMAAHTRDAILLMRLDGAIVDANPAAFRMYGYTREELLGLNVRDLRCKDTRDEIAGQMHRADTETILFETRHCHKDGAEFPVEVSSQGADIAGERLLVSVVRDISERKRAEQKTHSAALFVEQNPHPVLCVSAAGLLIFCNPASRSLLAEWGCAVGQPAPAAVRQAVAAAIDGNSHRELELTCGARELALVVSPLSELGYANLYAHDVTERNRRGRLLAKAERRQELLTRLTGRLLAGGDPQTLTDELAHEVMDALDCQVFFNFLVDPEHACLRLTAYAGISERESRAVERLEFGTGVCGWAAAAGERVVAEDIQNLQDPRTALIKSLGIQAYCCHPLMDGEKVIGAISFGSRTHAHFVADDLVFMQTASHQISIALDRMRSQKRLRESEERYRTIARSIPDGAVYVVDASWRILVTDGVLLPRLGFSRQTLEGKLVREAFPEDALVYAEPHLRTALAGDSAGYFSEYGGRTLWSQYVPLRDENCRIVAAMGLVLDVTERKRMEQRLLESQKMESVAVLAGGIAHDFNNLLVGILGNASLAQELLPADHAAANLLREVLNAGECAAHLTRQMLAYSGKGRFLIEPVNLSTLVREIVVLVRSSIPSPVALRLELAETLPAVDADRAQFQQIVMNLVINAGEAIGEREGSIAIRTRSLELSREALQSDWNAAELAPGTYVCLEVADTGCGMDEATRARIFDPFFTTKFTGRGLGLAAVSGIVRGHRGALRVESAPGQGSLFQLAFPSTAAAVERPAEKAAIRRARGQGRILVVDDEKLVRQVAQSLLQRMGYRVTAAKSGPEAIDVLSADPAAIDLVLLDLSMPGMNGRETLGRLRQLRPDLPVVMSSGYNESECRRMLDEQPVSGFLQKPYTLAMLEHSVQAVLRFRPDAG